MKFVMAALILAVVGGAYFLGPMNRTKPIDQEYIHRIAKRYAVEEARVMAEFTSRNHSRSIRHYCADEWAHSKGLRKKCIDEQRDGLAAMKRTYAELVKIADRDEVGHFESKLFTGIIICRDDNKDGGNIDWHEAISCTRSMIAGVQTEFEQVKIRHQMRSEARN